MAGGTTRYHRHTCKFREPASRTRTQCGCTPRLALRSTTTKPELPELCRGHACEPFQKERKTKHRRAELCGKCGNTSAGAIMPTVVFLLICHRPAGYRLGAPFIPPHPQGPAHQSAKFHFPWPSMILQLQLHSVHTAANWPCFTTYTHTHILT